VKNTSGILNTKGILGEIASQTAIRIAKAKEAFPPEQARKQAFELAEKEQLTALLPFERALASPGLSFICEVKKASPSKGVIAEDFPFVKIAKEYEEGGASAISVLTEPDFFLGSGQYMKEIAAAVQIPALRKDFIIDQYQLYEAKLWGAKAALLICALLEQETMSSFIKTAKELSLDCLVEIHDEAEAEKAVAAGARIIGINNRDLSSFNIDTSLTSRLRKFLPAGILTVAESGIKSPDDIRSLKETGVDAVLVGESLMRSADKKKFLWELREA
jgi:indole-3-glycerol phosphate synthase